MTLDELFDHATDVVSRDTLPRLPLDERPTMEAAALARALLAVMPVVRAAEAWLEHLEQRGGRYLDGVPGELCDAVDTMRARLESGK